MSWLWAVAAVLVLWAGIAAFRRQAEYSHRTPRPPRPPESPRPAHRPDDDDDAIDYDVLEEAEREVKDIDPLKPPEAGFEGDDWGPGTPKGFPPVP